MLLKRITIKNKKQNAVQIKNTFFFFLYQKICSDANSGRAPAQ
jgi:hypothetical protein